MSGYTPPENVRDTTFSEDTATSRTGSGPANLATIRAAIIAAIKDAGYLHVPEGRRDHTTPAETLHLHGLDYDRTGHSRNTALAADEGRTARPATPTSSGRHRPTEPGHPGPGSPLPDRRVEVGIQRPRLPHVAAALRMGNRKPAPTSTNTPGPRSPGTPRSRAAHPPMTRPSPSTGPTAGNATGGRPRPWHHPPSAPCAPSVDGAPSAGNTSCTPTSHQIPPASGKPGSASSAPRSPEAITVHTADGKTGDLHPRLMHTDCHRRHPDGTTARTAH